MVHVPPKHIEMQAWRQLVIILDAWAQEANPLLNIEGSMSFSSKHNASLSLLRAKSSANVSQNRGPGALAFFDRVLSHNLHVFLGGLKANLLSGVLCGWSTDELSMVAHLGDFHAARRSLFSSVIMAAKVRTVFIPQRQPVVNNRLWRSVSGAWCKHIAPCQ